MNYKSFYQIIYKNKMIAMNKIQMYNNYKKD